MGDSFADLRRSSRETEHKPVERKRGGAVPPDRTFSNGNAAVSNARNLNAKGEISKTELRGVERSVGVSKPSSSSNVVRGAAAKSEMQRMEKQAVAEKSSPAKKR